MSSPPADAQTLADTLARQDTLRAAVEPILEDGESWLVVRERDGVRVRPAGHDDPHRSLLRFTHPELYGRLLALEERMRTAGGWIGFELALILVLAGIAAVDGGWLVGLVDGGWLRSLQTGWVYAAYAVTVLVLVFGWRGWRASSCYRAHAGDLRRAVDELKLSWNEFPTWLEGDSAVRDVATQIKRQLADEARLRGGRHDL